MFCKKCGAQIADGQSFCNICGAPVEKQQVPPQGNPYQEQPGYTGTPYGQSYEPVTNEEAEKAARYQEYYKILAYFWIIDGIVMIISCVGIITGIWNLMVGIKLNKFRATIAPRNPQVVAQAKDSISNINVSFLLNFFLGGVFPSLAALAELYLRNQLLKDHELFGA